MASTFERVRGIIAERLGVDEDKIAMDSEFIADLNADSLDLVEVIMAMEQEFDLEIKDDEAEQIRSDSAVVESYLGTAHTDAGEQQVSTTSAEPT